MQLRCSVCNSPSLPDTRGRCRICRANEFSGLIVSASCKFCGTKTKLVSAEICKSCLKTRGLQKCRVCHELQMKLFDFSVKQNRCKSCRAKAPSLGVVALLLHLTGSNPEG
jgi:hypothetical protein